MCAKIVFTISYLLVILGSIGMIIFIKEFPLASNPEELKLWNKGKLMGLNGYQVWKYSWVAILFGTVGQLIACWMQ
jgi:hypothetical protein